MVPANTHLYALARAHSRTHARPGRRGPEKTKPGSASVNTAHCYGHSFPPRIFAPRGDPEARRGEALGARPALRSYIKKHQGPPFVLRLRYRVITTQAAESDLYPRFFFLALVRLPVCFAGRLLLLGVWFAAGGGGG